MGQLLGAFKYPWKQDLAFFLDHDKDVITDSFSIYTPVDLYRNDAVSGKLGNELYFFGKYFSPHYVQGSSRTGTDGKVYCVEYSECPFGRVSHFMVLELLLKGMIDGYRIDEGRKAVVDLRGKVVGQDGIDEIGRLASRHFLDGGVKYLLETAKVGYCANVIELR